MDEPDRRQAAANNLIAVLTRRPVATIDELKAVLQTDVRMTVYRVLKDIAYQTSYSHGGRYYALKELMEFDQHGLWSARSVWFSKHGTLMATLEQCIRDAERGYFSSELEALLHVGAKESLLRLTQQGRVSRERVSHGYLYCSTDAAMRRRQLAARAAELGRLIEPLVAPAGVSEDVKAAIVLVAALCDERWRRSPPIGPRRRRLDCRPPGPWPRVGKSCSRARCWSTASASRARDGRGSKKTPAIVDEIRALMQPETAGDPMTGLKWTRKTTPKPYDSKALPWGAARSVACSHRWIFAGASITRSGRRRRPRIGTSSFA